MMSGGIQPTRATQRDVFVALGLSIGAAVALGLSRFAYALLLPPMRAAHDWSYVEAGSLNTANAAGYILGAFATAWFAKQWGQARVFQVSLLISSTVLLLTGAVVDFTVLILLRTIGGVSTAFTFVLGAGLVGAIRHDRDSAPSGKLIGIYVAGAGFGIVVSGLTVPIALQIGADGWRAGWGMLGILALIGVPPAWIAAGSVLVPTRGGAAMLRVRQFGRLMPTLLGYGLFGAGYVGYMTFIIALLQVQAGESAQTTVFWIVLGLTSMVSAWLWGPVLGRIGGGRGPAAVFAICMFGTLPVLIQSSLLATLVSAVLFGSSFMAGPAAITIVARQQLPKDTLIAGIALLTVAFALGQAVGPMLSGIVSDSYGDVAAGLWLSPLLLGLAATTALMQSPAQRPDELMKGGAREMGVYAQAPIHLPADVASTEKREWPST